MPLFGNIIVIKRNGTDGIAFPLTASSCLFGRRTECDIRIQLPQVSKEHCKIEINENKEAILTNLSTVNPTQLNGGCFQQPVPLKHGDVLTIIDRSFRFEYPLQSTPRKRRSRSPKDETLQVLHVQQVAEVELSRKQTSGSKSLHASGNGECEGKHANENKQNTEENISKSVPVKLQTPNSSHRIHQSIRKQNERSPFSELYEKLRHEIKVKKPLHEGNESQKAAKEDGKSVLPEPGARISSSSCVYDLGSQTKEKELGRSENVEECKRKVEQDVISSELNQISAAGSAARKSFTRSPRICGSKEVSRDSGKRSDMQDHSEPSTVVGRSKDTEITPKASKEKDGNAAFSRKLCSIQCLDYPYKAHSSTTALDKPAPTTNRANVSGVDKYVLSTPTSRRKSLQSHFISPTKETSGMNPVNTDTPTTRRGVSLKPESVSEISAETQREDSVWRNESPKQLPLEENKCLKQRRNSKQRTPGKLVQDEVPKEIYDKANAVNSKEGRSETPASYCNSKSPRRNNRPSQELSNKSFRSEKLAWEGLTPELVSPVSQKSGSGRKRSRAQSPGLRSGEALETNAGQEHHYTTTDRKDGGTKEEVATNEGLQRQDSEDAGVTGLRRLSSKRKSSGSLTVPKDNVTGSEMSISGLLAGEESGQTKSISQKRKSGDLLLQPLGKRKRVSFGGHLSPELFDKSLPPNSPLKKGAIPARQSVPFGNSPRAVLKKSRGSKLFAAQELSERSQKEKMSPKNLPTQKSPAASSPVSGKATPTFTLESPATYTKGRFSICCITAPLPIAEEKDAVAEDVNTKEKNSARVKTPKSSPINQHDKSILTATPDKLTRSAQLALKVTPLRRRSRAVAVFNAKRRSGASSANLLVAKSWAEVVKLGVARPQSKTVKKSARKGRCVKKITKSPKTPERKIKSHFSTGHAESPATIVVGRAYSTAVRTAGRVPKVVKNPILKLNMNMDESFTGMTEMFQTPEDKSGKTLPLATVQKADFTPTCTAMEMSDLHTPEETGEMMVSPLNNSDASEQKQDSPGFCHFLREKSLKSMFDAIATKTPEKGKAVLEENISVDSLTIPDECASRVKSGSKRRTPKQKLEPLEVVSGLKQLLRTPKQRSEPVEALSGIKELMETPKQRSEPVEALSGVKELMETPKQRSEPVEALSGVKELMETPKQRSEPVEALSGVKELMETPKQRSEPVEALSGVKELMETPKQRSEPVEALSGVKELMETPKQRSEPVEALSGVKELMETPKQRSEPVEALSGVKELMETPKQRSEPVEALSGVKELMETPKQRSEPVEALSGVKELMETPKQRSEPVEALSGVKELMETPKQRSEPVEALSGVKELMETPKQRSEPVEALSGVKELMETPKQRSEPVEALSGVKELMETPKQRSEPVEALSGVKELMETPKQRSEPVEALSGVKELMETPKQRSEPVEALSGVKELMETPKQRSEPVEALSGVKELMETPKQRSEPVEALSGVKELMKTPKQRSEPVEALSGVKELMKTPKQRSEPVVVLSGIKELMKTPKQRSEPVVVLSGIKELMKTPKQRSEPVVVLSGIKELMKTPKQRSEPVVVLSGIKELMKTPKQRSEPVETSSGIKELIKTPKQRSEPVEALSRIKYFLRTRKQKSEPVEVLSGIKRLMRTPRQKAEPVEVLSGIKQLMKTPQQELEPVTDEIAFRRLLKTPVQEKEAGKAVAGVTLIEKTPKLKYQPVEDMIGVSRLFKTPKEKVEPIEDVFGISKLVKTPREKSQPVDDFVGLQRLMAEPRWKSSNFDVDYVGVTEMFDTPEEIKVRSVNVMDSKTDNTAPPCTNSSHQNEDKGNISQGEASQQKESTSEEQPTQRPTRGRLRKTGPPASARQREKDLNVKELQGLEKTTTQEETEETSTSTSAAKNKGRGRRTKHCIQEEIVSKLPEQEEVETVSFVEPHGVAPRPGRGKRKEPKELKVSSENLESSGQTSSVLRKEPANMNQILQEHGISDIVETEGDPTVNTVSVSGSVQHENVQPQTGLKKAENEFNEGGGEDSEEIFLSPGKRSRGVKKVENTDLLIPPKRGRRAKNDQVKQAAPEDIRGTRRLRKDPSAKVIQKHEQTSDKDAETATAEESENRTELEIKTTERRAKSLRSVRKHSAEAKADICETALENTQTIQKTQETSAKTDSETQSHLKNEIKVSQGDETANAQENITEASQRLKAESPSGGTKKMLVTALNLEANCSAVGETNRTRNRRGKNDALEKKTVNNLEIIAPKFKSETEMDESSLKDSLGSACVKNPHQVTKDQGDPAGTSIPAANSDSLACGHQKRTRNEQRTLKTKRTAILQENQAENHGVASRRGRGRKVQFVLEEASSKAVGDKSSPEDDKGMTHKDGQHQTSENPSSQVRRSRRKQVDSMPQIACPTFMEKQTSNADHSQDEAFVKEQDSALGAAPSSTEEHPLRRGKRREVAAAAPTSKSLPIRKRRGLLEGDDKKTTVREDQNPALGNQTLQAKANASATGKRKKIDLVAEAKRSSPPQGQHDLSETADKEESTNEEQNVPLETVSCANEKPLGRGRRKATAPASHTTSYVSLRGKRGLPADKGGEATPEEAQNVPLETSDSSVKENQPRKGRRKENVILLEATSSTSMQGKQGLSKASGRKNNREAKKLNLENSASQKKMDLSKGNSRQTTTSLAGSSTSLQGLPEDGKNETLEEPQDVLLEAAPSAKENPSRVGRRKTISSKPEETSSTFLGEELALPQNRRQKRILKESEDTSLENNSSQEKTRQLRNKRKKVEFQAEAATSTSIRKNNDLPENGDASETQNVRLASTGSEKINQPGKGKGISPGQAAASASRRTKCPFPAHDLASKKPKTENDENGALQKGKRNKTREEPGEEAARAAGGTDRRTRSSARTRKESEQSQNQL